MPLLRLLPPTPRKALPTPPKVPLTLRKALPMPPKALPKPPRSNQAKQQQKAGPRAGFLFG